jgi:hypothetical protein
MCSTAAHSSESCYWHILVRFERGLASAMAALQGIPVHFLINIISYLTTTAAAAAAAALHLS